MIPSPAQSKTILLVEDDNEVGIITTIRLQLCGYQVIRSETLAGALPHVDRPDLILLDLRLPDSDGDATCERIAAHSTRTPIIVLTATRKASHQLAMSHLGAYMVLSKGADGTFAAGLADRIEEVIEAHRPIRETYDLLGDIRRVSGA